MSSQNNMDSENYGEYEAGKEERALLSAQQDMAAGRVMDDSKEALENAHIYELREQDRWLPINNVARLMKNTLPMTAKVSKDAKECMQECVSEFISFVTSEAGDRCTADKRKTINGEDILISLHALGFENYAEVLKIYLAKYRHQQALRNQQMLEEEEARLRTERQVLPLDSGNDDEQEQTDIAQQQEQEQ